MHSSTTTLLRSLAAGALLLWVTQPATAYVLTLFGPPGPTAGYGEFYESAQSGPSVPTCPVAGCEDGGVGVFAGTDLETTYDDWVTSVGAHHGVPSGSFFGEDFDGPLWSHNQLFDSQNEPTGAPPIADGVTMSNDLPDALAGPPDGLPLIPGRADAPAKADRTPGSSPAIDRLAWEAQDDFDDGVSGIPEATIDFSMNKTDFLGFYIFDASDPGTYNLQYTDGTIFSFVAASTRNQNDDDEGFYRFIGFVNTHSTAQINRFWITNSGSRYGIDEIEWGRGVDVPEPGTLLLTALGGLLLLFRMGHRFSRSTRS